MKELFGGCLMAGGILIAGASGLCSVMMLIGSSYQGLFDSLLTVGLFGGIPLLGGIGLAVLGRSLIREGRGYKQE